MSGAEQVCCLLLHGELDAEGCPELDEEATVAEVRARLAGCGLLLRRSAGRWSAIPDADGSTGEGLHPGLRLTAAEAVLALVLAASVEEDGWAPAPLVRSRLLGAYSAHWVDRTLSGALARGVAEQRGGRLRPGRQLALLGVEYARELVLSTGDLFVDRSPEADHA